MPRTVGQKRKLSSLLAILASETDEEHSLPLCRLITLLSERYGISAERKSVYDDIETLLLMGHDIVRTGAGRNTAYYLGARSFELAEWKLLADAVQSSRFLSEKKADSLIRKLTRDASVWQRERIMRQVYVANRMPVGGEAILYTVDLLHEGISTGRMVSFSYVDIDVDGRRVFRHGGEPYTVSPWALCWDDEFYYLIAYSAPDSGIRHYRVDKMVSLRVLPDAREGEALFRNFDMGRYSRATFGMFGGEITAVTLRCRNRLAGVIRDRFGTESVLRKREDGMFDVTVSVAVSPQFLAWVMGFGDEMRILSPSSAKEALCELAQRALDGYGGTVKESN